MGYPSKAWYNRALAATVEQIYSTSDSDSEILADVANSGAGAGATTKAARKALGYDGYIVKGSMMMRRSMSRLRVTSLRTRIISPRQ